MSHDHVFQATLAPAGVPSGVVWEIAVAGVGVTQVIELADARQQATDLVAITHPELAPQDIRVEFVR